MNGPSADAILAALPDAVYVVDTDRRITYWNAAAERMTGWSAADVMGKRCRDGILNHVDDRGRSLCGRRCPLLRTMRDGSPARAHPFLHDRGGRRLPVVVSAAPLYDAAGAIAGAVEAFHDDSHFHDLTQDLAQAERAARTDQLTGLGNRRMLDAALEQAVEDRAPWAVLFVDVDRFKSVNDRFGHEAGDAVLRNVARALRRCCRTGDTIGRWGGDEFVVLTRVDDEEAGLAQARRLRRRIGATVATADPHKIRVTASVGVAVARPGEAAAVTVARADAAMLAAKASGRNQARSA